MLSKDERPAVLRELEPNRKSADPLPLPDDEKSRSPETFDLRGAVALFLRVCFVTCFNIEADLDLVRVVFDEEDFTARLSAEVVFGLARAVFFEAFFTADFAARLSVGVVFGFGRPACFASLISALTFATLSLRSRFSCSFARRALSFSILFRWRSSAFAFRASAFACLSAARSLLVSGSFCAIENRTFALCKIVAVKKKESLHHVLAALFKTWCRYARNSEVCVLGQQFL